MNKTTFLHDFQTNIPAPVRNFLIRALLIFVGWKLLYSLILLPVRMPDQQLTNLTAKTTSLFYNAIHHSSSTFTEINNQGGHETIFYIDGQRAIGIADRCNALELIVLYIGFLFCISESWKKQLLYATAGTAGIFILNILRCYALAILNLNHSSVADFAHHYLFTLIIYGLIFITWVRYSKSYFRND